MNNEEKLKIKEYIKLLKANVVELSQKVEDLKAKSNGNELKEEDLGAFQSYTLRIERYQKELADLNNLTIFDDMKAKLNKLTKVKTTIKEKVELKKELIKFFSWYENWNVTLNDKEFTVNSGNIERLMEQGKNAEAKLESILGILGIDQDSVTIKEALAKKNKDLEVLKSYGADTSKVEEDIKELQESYDIVTKCNARDIESKLESVKECNAKLERVSSLLANINEIENELYLISDKKTTKEEKKELVKKYNEFITRLEDEEFKEYIKKHNLDFDFINLEMTKLKDDKKSTVLTTSEEEQVVEEQEPKEEEKRTVADLFNEGETHLMRVDPEINFEKESFFERNKRKICGVLIGAIAVTAAGFGLYHLSKKGYTAKNSNNVIYTDDNIEPTEEPIMEAAPEAAPTEDTLENKLMNIGYSYEAASLIPIYFDEFNINRLLNVPYDLRVESYADVSGFNYQYIREYEEIRHLYNLTSNKTVDYVNRAHTLKEFNFLDDAELADYVAFVNAIDNKALFRNEFVEANNTLNNITNTITSHLMDSLVMGTNNITVDDINKINALAYIAPEGSDLDMCMTKYAEIVTGIINDPNNMELREKGFKFVQIFVTSANNFNNTLNSETLIPESEISNVLTGDAAFDEAAKVLDDADWYIAYDGVITPLSYMIFAPGDGDDEEFQKWDDVLSTGERHLDAIRGQICGDALTLTMESGE